jgi:NAD+ diphosphatase
MARDDRPPPARPFTGMVLDRATEQRKHPEELERLLEDPAARSVLAGPDGVVVRGGELLRSAERPPALILLGLDGGHGVFALDLETLADTERARIVDGAEVISLRDAGATLAHAEAGLAAYATALLNWHRRHGFCANCGAESEIVEGGYSRRCPRCGANHFPRTDPVVIMTVEHERRLLMGRRAGWPAGRFSVLAGFISPGESAEEAVIREVAEEAGIVARDPAYVSSQPWPFPASLMLGFEAASDGGEPVARDGELEEVAWFELDAVREAGLADNPALRLPHPVSIARFLIDRWVEQRDGYG